MNNVDENRINDCPWLSEVSFKLGKQFDLHQTKSDNIKSLLKMEARNLDFLGYELFIQFY